MSIVPDEAVDWYIYDVSPTESICVYRTNGGIFGVWDTVQGESSDTPVEAALYRAAIDGITSLLLALFEDGVVVKDEVVQTAVMAAANNL